MKKFSTLLAGMVGLSCVPACLDPDPAESVAFSAVGGDDSGVYDIQPQGQWLIGSQLDLPPFTGAGHFFVDRATKDGHAIPLTVVNDASLRSGIHVGADRWFDGVIVSNGTIELRLTSPSGDSRETHYKLLRRSTGEAFDTDVCGPDGIDAIPLAGVFKTDGLHVPEPGRITFACGNAVAHKCALWGYPAGPSPGLRWNGHQACTRMARADYGANGRSHTRMETAIKIADAVPGVNDLPVPGMFGDVSVWPPDPSKFYFEAAWWPGTHKAGCLSKVRWNSLPVGDPGLGLPDPRLDASAKNCEDLVVEDLVDAGALTFIGSLYNDLGLLMWHADTEGGRDYVTTVRGYHAEVTERIWRPFPSYHTYYHDSTVGFLLRKIPGSITDPNAVIPVHIFREIANDRMVLAGANDPRLSTGYAQDPEREGYVFSWQREGSIAFRLYRNADTGDYLSTVDGAVPGGYDWVANIGWIMGPEQVDP